jgi:hypothetical protein
MPVISMTPRRIVMGVRLGAIALLSMSVPLSGGAQARACDATVVQRLEIDDQIRDLDAFADRTLSLVISQPDGSVRSKQFNFTQPRWWLDLESVIPLQYVPRTLKLFKAEWTLDPDPARQTRFAWKDGRCTVTEPMVATHVWDAEVSVDGRSVFVRKPGTCPAQGCDNRPTAQRFFAIPRSKPFVFVVTLASWDSIDKPIDMCVVNLTLESIPVVGATAPVGAGKFVIPAECRAYIERRQSYPYVPSRGVGIKNITAPR